MRIVMQHIIVTVARVPAAGVDMRTACTCSHTQAKPSVPERREDRPPASSMDSTPRTATIDEACVLCSCLLEDSSSPSLLFMPSDQ